MSIYLWVLIACWAVFLFYWGYSALRIKKTTRSSIWNSRTVWRLRIALAVVVVGILLVNVNAEHHQVTFRVIDPTLGTIGDICAILGVAFAIWARTHLGSNWGMPMAVKEKPDLITSGPYAYVRHPIYSGVLLALFGTALISGWAWMAMVVVGFFYFFFSAKVEEKRLLERFPAEYPAYQKQTKMLIPFLF